MFGLMQTEIKRCCWSTKEGATLKTYPQVLDTATYREDSLTSYSFHFMAQTSDHKPFPLPTTETLPDPESFPTQAPFIISSLCD